MITQHLNHPLLDGGHALECLALKHAASLEFYVYLLSLFMIFNEQRYVKIDFKPTCYTSHDWNFITGHSFCHSSDSRLTLMSLKSWLELQRAEEFKSLEDMEADENGVVAWFSAME